MKYDESLKEITDEEARKLMVVAEEKMVNGTLEPMNPELESLFDEIIEKQWEEFRENYDGDIGFCGINIEEAEGKAKILMAYAASEENAKYDEE